MAHIKNRLRGLLTAFVALVAALAIVPGTALADMAWPADGQGTPGTGSITITGDDVDTNSDITVYRVADITLGTDNVPDFTAVNGFDQSLVTAWISSDGAASDALAIANAKANAVELQDGQYSITAGNPDGVVISGLSAGLYYVEIATDGEVTYQPIVVSVEPKAVEGTTNWTIGDTSIAVKSTTSTITKTVINEDGEEVTMPSGEVNDTFTFKATFSIGQDMSFFELTDDPIGITVDTSTIKLFKSDGTPVAPIDGVTIADVATVTQGEGEDGFTMSFLTEWLKNDANVGDYYITYEGSINEDAAVDQTHNEIKSNINTDGDKVEIKVAELQIRKYENTDKVDGYQEGDKLLGGAVFELYKTYTDANNNTFIPGEAGPIEVVTNNQGIAQIPGDVVLEVGGSYVLVEKEAPSGYKPDETPIQVTLNADGSMTTVDVENIPLGEDEGIDLPETGGMGTVALTAAGVVLVAGAAAFIVRSRKQN